jgi:hypothetical protein
MPLPEALPAIELPHVAAEFKAAGPDRPATITITHPHCTSAAEGEIVVCAGDPRRNRLAPLPSISAETLPKAEARLSDSVTVDLHTDQQTISGVPSNRVMAGIKFAF